MQNESTYREICNNVRVTDDISFKLLSLVQLVSGSTVLVLVMKGDIFWLTMIFGVSFYIPLCTFRGSYFRTNECRGIGRPCCWC